jgi:hypothetical protein
MKKAILMAVFAGVSGVSWAQQWVRVSETDTFVGHIDSSTIRKDGHMRRFWMIQDLAKPDKEGDRSYLALWEINCKEERIRSLQVDYFRGQMATDQRSGGRNSPLEWAYVAPGSVADAQMKFVCSR